MIDAPEKIQAAFQAAMDQRSKFILAMPGKITSVAGLDTSLENFDNKHLFLEASSINSFNPEWQGLQLTCYFKLITKKKPRKEMFFNFSSSIAGIEKKKNGQVIFKLTLPDKLDIGQRRSSLRLEMDINLLKGFSVWPEDRFIRHNPETGKKGLHKPLIALEHMQNGLFKIIDISAGGMKLRSTAAARDISQGRWRKGSTMIIWMVLLDPEKETREECWVKGRIKYRFEDFVSKDMDLGIEFISHGRITPDKKMKWVPVKDHNIDQIGNWTYQRYLAQYRQGIV
ncbi:MAG: hypothetical protein ACOCV7_05275 [Desulfonatronovibrionaceae bacterium]